MSLKGSFCHNEDVHHKSNPSTSSNASSQCPLPSLSSCSTCSTCSSNGALQRRSSSLRRRRPDSILLPPSPTTAGLASPLPYSYLYSKPPSVFFPPRRVSFNDQVDVIPSALGSIAIDTSPSTQHCGTNDPATQATPTTGSPSPSFQAPPVRQRLWDESQLAMELADDEVHDAHRRWYHKMMDKQPWQRLPLRKEKAVFSFGPFAVEPTASTSLSGAGHQTKQCCKQLKKSLVKLFTSLM